MHLISKLLLKQYSALVSCLKTKHNSFLSLSTLISLFFVFFTPPLIQAAPTVIKKDAEKKKIVRKIQMQEMNVIQLQKDLEAEKDKIDTTHSKEKVLLAKLEKIDLKLQQQQAKLKKLQLQMITQKKLIAVKEGELQEVKDKKRIIQGHLQKRISSYYKLDRVSLVNITFSAANLPDILNFHDSFQTLISYDQDIITTYRKSIDALGRAREALTLEEGLLHEFITRADKEKVAIEKSKEEMEVLLTHIRTQSKLHKQSLVELQKETDKLSSSLRLLRKKEERLDQDFLLSKGTLPLPVEGKIITLFGTNTTNSLGTTKKSTGISISAPDATQVKSIFKGTVFYSGYLRSYGKTIIVHHGYQYYSVISRVEKLLKRKGDTVQQGSILALMGDTAMVLEDGIQLEIRHGSHMLDPLQWLNKSKLQYRINN